LVEYTNDRVIYVSGLKNKLLKLGFDPTVLPERIMPSTYSTWNLKQKRSFIRGCYSANGSVLNAGRVTYKTTCRGFAEQLVSTLDQDFNIKAYITTNRPKDVEFSNGTYTVKESYDVNIANFEGMNKFYNEIGFIHRYKMYKLRDMLVNKAPKVTNVINLNTTEKVYDFNEPMTHWGIVEGVIVHNCSEYHFLDNTACNLASINLLKFLNVETGQFDVEGYLYAIRLMQITLDISVTMAQLPSKEIAEGTYNYRTTGGGYGNLGQLLMTLGLPYDSEEGRSLAGVLTSILTGQAYKTSAELAEIFGGFPRYKENESSMRRVLHNHRVATYGDYASQNKLEYDKLSIIPIGLNHEMLNQLGFNGLSGVALSLWDEVVSAKKFNSAFVTCIAPTGTIGLLMDFDTTSLEPSFSLIAYKKLAGGGYMMIPNRGIGIALKRLGYTEEQVNEIVEYVTTNSNIENAPYIKLEHLPIFDTANKNEGGTRYIRPMGHVEMLAATSAFLSGSSSKTVNLPNNATVEDFEEVHMKSWELGVKCVALFRDGCKASQPMNTSLNSQEVLTQKYEEMKYDELVETAYKLEEKTKKPTRISPPSIRKAVVHEAKVGSMGVLVKVGFYDDGRVAEVYADTNDSQLVKGLLNTLTIMASHMIQRNVAISEVTSMLRKEKFEPSGFVTKHPTIKRVDSLGDLIAKVLEIENDKETIPTPTKEFKVEDIADAKDNGKKVYGEKCSSCGGENLKQNGTCKVCLDCGSTTGCS
jgi:ribonucleoside-diphosphate reductase alpha chain